MKLGSKNIPNFWEVKMLVVMFMLFWFGSPTIAQVSNTCFQTLLEGDCASPVNHTACCPAISKEFRKDQECMCNAYNTSDLYVSNLFEYCSMSVHFPIDCPANFTTPASSTTPANNSTTPASSNPPSNDDLKSGTKKTSSITAIVVPVGIIVVLIIIGISVFYFCKRRPKTTIPITKTSRDYSGESPLYELATLKTATNDFSIGNKIGEGGFGIVYMGTLPNGDKIAIKKLTTGSTQGDKEFEAEIKVLPKLQHRNLVKLVGFCLDEAILVYEFMPMGSLSNFIFEILKREKLEWPTRFEIIKGIAGGIKYLHQDSGKQTIHRDLKAANILLDADMTPKIADFGLARICDLDKTHDNTMRVIGTPGYMSPEYKIGGEFSAHSDVYAFGVIILEIISGTSINSGPKYQSRGETVDLLTYAWRSWQEKKPLALIDPLMKVSISSNDEINRCIHLALLCVQDAPKIRPEMSKIVHILNAESGVAHPTLTTPVEPEFLKATIFDEKTTSTTAPSVSASTN